MLADWDKDGTGAAAPTHLPVAIQKASLRGYFQDFCCCCQARRCRSPSLPHQPLLWMVLLVQTVQLSLVANSWLFWKCSRFPSFGWLRAISPMTLRSWVALAVLPVGVRLACTQLSSCRLWTVLKTTLPIRLHLDFPWRQAWDEPFLSS